MCIEFCEVLVHYVRDSRCNHIFNDGVRPSLVTIQCLPVVLPYILLDSTTPGEL